VFLVASSIGIGEKKVHARVTRKVCFLVSRKNTACTTCGRVHCDCPRCNNSCTILHESEEEIAVLPDTDEDDLMDAEVGVEWTWDWEKSEFLPFPCGKVGDVSGRGRTGETETL